jgi:hypothetical protein
MNLAITSADQAVYLVLGLLGLAVCFFGYRLFRFWLLVAGLQAGFILGLLLGSSVFRSEVMIMVVAILCGILAAGLSFTLVKVGAFIAGAATLAMLVILVMKLLGKPANVFVVFAAVLLGGLLAIFAVRPFLILATAANGAYLVADSAANLIGGYPLSQYLQTHTQIKPGALALLLVGLVVLTVLGAAFQFREFRQRSRSARQAAAVSAAAAETGSSVPAQEQPGQQDQKDQ